MIYSEPGLQEKASPDIRAAIENAIYDRLTTENTFLTKRELIREQQIKNRNFIIFILAGIVLISIIK